MPHESSLIGAGERSGDRQVKQVKQVKQQACSQILELGLGTVLYTVSKCSVIDKDSRQPRFENRTVQIGMSPPSTAPSPKKPEWKARGSMLLPEPSCI
ncbi:hypothetical protein VTJ04DRAFT_2984 [Mycothermus thermophilus]|uniref:uncharacterized protein n=1 Tax=Humicola insolens TaxID=85995 RepID=UPI0037433327